MDRFGLLSLIIIGATNMAMAGTVRSFPKEKAIVTGEIVSSSQDCDKSTEYYQDTHIILLQPHRRRECIEQDPISSPRPYQKSL